LRWLPSPKSCHSHNKEEYITQQIPPITYITYGCTPPEPKGWQEVDCHPNWQ
jgi:hypothetical protein